MPHRMPFVALAVACGLIAAMQGRSITAAEIPPEQRAAIETIIHDYLLKNPDVMIEALRSAEDKLNREADAKATTVLNDRAKEIFDDPATPVGGNPRGDVTIVEFFDYRCPYCKQVLPVLQTILKEDHKLRFVYKEMPVLGPASVVAAHAALAAQRQGKYEAFHTAMMATKGSDHRGHGLQSGGLGGTRCRPPQAGHDRTRDRAGVKGKSGPCRRAQYPWDTWFHRRQQNRSRSSRLRRPEEHGR